ncbi:hypothetical protein BJ912DRAFT_938853 [Pholiota molesta]|nr:hypothetical protein BJ912DRAFT_938853 [Pholiota molesta]
MRLHQKVTLLSIQCLACSILAAAQISNCLTGALVCCTTIEPLTPQNVISLSQIFPIPTMIPEGDAGLGCSETSVIDTVLKPCAGTLACCTTFVPTLEFAIGCEPI